MRMAGNAALHRRPKIEKAKRCYANPVKAHWDHGTLVTEEKGPTERRFLMPTKSRAMQANGGHLTRKQASEYAHHCAFLYDKVGAVDATRSNTSHSSLAGSIRTVIFQNRLEGDHHDRLTSTLASFFIAGRKCHLAKASLAWSSRASAPLTTRMRSPSHPRE
jgi:hypothetical protein